MKKLKKPVLVITSLAVVAGAVLGAFMLVKHRKARLSKAPKFGLRPRPVTVAETELGDYVEKRHYLAVVEPANRSNISARVTASVVNVLKDEGDKAKAGETLIQLDSREIKYRIDEVSARIQQAKAELAANNATIESVESSWQYWQKEAERDKKLAKEDAIPESQAERTDEKAAEVKGNLQAARQRSKAINQQINALKQQKDQLQTTLSYHAIEGPYDGVVSRRFVDPGDLATPGKILLEIEDKQSLKLSFDVPQKDLPEVKQGLPVIFSVQDQSRPAVITLMYPSLNKSRMVRAEAWLANELKQGLSTGSYVSVSVVVREKRDVTLVPRSSLIESPKGQKYVFIVRKQRLKPITAELLGHTDNHAAVEGVEPGEQVVENTFLGWSRLSSGERVKAVR